MVMKVSPFAWTPAVRAVERQYALTIMDTGVYSDSKYSTIKLHVLAQTLEYQKAHVPAGEVRHSENIGMTNHLICSSASNLHINLLSFYLCLKVFFRCLR